MSSNRFFKERGIFTGIHYPIPIHLQKAVDFLGYKKGDIPVTENVVSQILSLPMYAEICEAEIKHVVDLIKPFLNCLKIVSVNGKGRKEKSNGLPFNRQVSFSLQAIVTCVVGALLGLFSCMAALVLSDYWIGDVSFNIVVVWLWPSLPS